jgi:serine/threonine protein kinase/WD40 repeat protein
MDSKAGGKYEQLDRLADEFATRLRLGERPTLAEFIERYPELTREIHELFPAMVELECAEPRDESSVSPLYSVGDYRILRVIGRGGMGVVYEARQSSLDRQVALKILPLHRSLDPRSVERFRREARSAAQLHHTNIVPVFEVGQVGDTCFYAMQFIKGQGLDQVIEDLRRLCHATDDENSTLANFSYRSIENEQSLASSLLLGSFHGVATKNRARDNLPPIEAAVSGGDARSGLLPGKTDRSSVHSNRRRYFKSVAHIGQQVAGALAYAHDRGIVHRDVKPSNLLLDASGIVWVTDFGLAKTEENGLTETGDLLGTYRYMAPERFEGKGDGRADVYALGLTLYELILLRPAFPSRDRAQLLKWVQEREPERPRAVDPDIPSDLETIVLKAIAKNPAQRYQTAESMGEDLRRFLNGEPIQARRTSFFERSRLWCRRYPALVGLYIVLFAAVAGATLAAVYLNSLLRKSEFHRQQKDEAEQKAVEELFASTLAQADARRVIRKLGQRFATLEAIRKAAGIARERGMGEERLGPLRNVAIAALALPDIRKIREFDPFGPEFTFVWSVDASNRFMAGVLSDGTIAVCRIQDGSQIAKVKLKRPVGAITLSSDGRYLVAWASSHHFRVWDIIPAEPRIIIDDDEEYGLTFHPDSKHLAVGRADGSLDLLDLSGHDPIRTLAKPNEKRLFPRAFNPQGNLLAVTNGGTAQILDVQTGEIVKSLAHSSDCSHISWHPDGRHVALTLSTWTIEVWDVEHNRRVSILEGCTLGGISTVFSPSGELLISWGWEGKLRVWHVRTGKQVLQYPDADELVFLPDGLCLIKCSRRIVLAEFAPGSEYRTLGCSCRPHSKESFREGAIHPGGRLFAVRSKSGFHAWDLEHGDEVYGTLAPSVYSLTFTNPNELMLNTPAGLLSLSVQFETGEKTLARIGPARPITQSSNASFSSSLDGSIICRGRNPSGGADLILRHGNSTIIRPLKLSDRVGGTAISPDGRFVVTFPQTETGKTRVWDSTDGHKVSEVDTGSAVFGALSNKWLAVRGRKMGRIIPVGDWDKGRPLESDDCLAFSPSGDLLGVEAGEGAIRLVDPGTGNELARFEDPNQDKAYWMGFSPDGTRIVTTSSEGAAIHIWDLSLIRKELASLGLDWVGPPIPESREFMQSGTRLQAQIDLTIVK